MSIDILCVGHASYDLSMFVERFPAENSKSETLEWMECGGGPAANAAYLASVWGARCALAGVVGNDVYAARIREELQSAAVDVSLLETRPRHATPVSMILINNQNGSRTIVNRKAPGAPLQVEAGALAEMRPRVLLFDGHELEASRAALEAFPDAVSILDAGSWRAGTADLAGRVDYLAASERFALQATGLAGLHDEAEEQECVRRLRAEYSTWVIVTLGEKGLAGEDEAGYFRLPAYPAPVVDTTAAGDIFHGALAYALAGAAPLRESLRLASMAASLSVRVAGGRASIPRLAEVREALAHAG
jgi:sulfofructose kinase